MDNEKIKKGGLLYLIKIAYRNIFRNMRRSILCIVAVSMAVFIMVFMMSYIEGMLDSAKRIAQTFESSDVKITSKEYEKKEAFMPLQYPINDFEMKVNAIKDIKGVKVVTSRINSYATFTTSKIKHGIVSGVNFKEILETAKDNSKNKYAYHNYTEKTDGLLIGRFPDETKNECMIGYRLAKKMEIVYPLIEKNEFEWLLDNIENEEHKNILRSSYNSDENKGIYVLRIFNNGNPEYANAKNKTSNEQTKKTLSENRSSYLQLLDIFMSFEVKKLPKTLGTEANVLDELFILDYERSFFNSFYSLNNGIYELVKRPSEADKEYLIYLLDKAVTLKIPFKIISSQYSDKYYSPALVGIFDYDYAPVDESFIMIPFARMQKLASLRDQTQNIMVYVNDINKAPKIKNEIISVLKDDNLIVKDWTQFPFIAMFSQFEYIYFVIYAVFLIVASFLIINTVIMVIHERIKEIGMMGTIGMNRSEIVRVFFFEAVLLSLLGAVAGTLLGALLTGITSNMPISIEALSGGVDFPVSNTIFIKFSPVILLKGFLFGTLLTSFCTIFPSLKSAFIEPVEALRR